MTTPQRRLALAVLGVLLAGARLAAGQVTVQPPYDAAYSITDLGPVPSLPSPYGGLTFKAGDTETILIGGGGGAGGADGMLYAIGVVRDASQHITGFSGAATAFAAAANNDGGVAYGPGGVLFLARYPLNQMGETKPGSTVTDKIVDLSASPLSVLGSPGGLNFVPAGFPGAGQLKIVGSSPGDWYTLTLVPDTSGTYDATVATAGPQLAGEPKGFVYVPPGSPLFTDFTSILVAEWSFGVVSTYTVDVKVGDPVVTSRVEFVTGLAGAEGAAVDPVSGDFLFSASGGHVIAVRGTPVPTTTTTTATTTTTTLPSCGNGTVDPGEQCDDGARNGTATSCCSTECTLLTTGATCGAMVTAPSVITVPAKRVGTAPVVIPLTVTLATGLDKGTTLQFQATGFATQTVQARVAAPPGLVQVTKTIGKKFRGRKRARNVKLPLNALGKQLLKQNGGLNVTVVQELAEPSGKNLVSQLTTTLQTR